MPAVGFIHPRRVLRVFIRGVRDRLPRQHQVVLPLGNLPLHRVDLLGVGIRFLLHQVAQQCLGVLGIEQREARLVAQRLQFAANDVEPQGVEGRDRQAVALSPLEHLPHALLHLARRLVGEGHRRDLARAHSAFLDQVGDLGGDHAGLAGPGTGQHQARAVDIPRGFLLAGIELGEALANRGRGAHDVGTASASAIPAPANSS